MLRTPSAIEGQGGAIREDVARAKNRMLMVRDQVAQLAFENNLPVPDAIARVPEARLEGQVEIIARLPTPTTRDHKDGTVPHERDGVVQLDTIARAVVNGDEVTEFSWGKFEPAIRRWEKVTGHPAPNATEPTGKNGTHRLSSKLTEWMMGLPLGWITGHGISRTAELKLAGNGVCPQQAVLALTLLTQDLDI